MNENTLYTLFIVCPIGFEEIQQQELKRWINEFGHTVVNERKLIGGIEFSTTSLEIINIISYLKVSTKVLLRINQFKVRDFPKLYNKVKKFDWSPYLFFAEDIQVNVTLKKSRLIHSGRAKESIEKGLQEWLRANPRKKIKEKFPPQKLHFNIIEDVCQVSIDLCGKPLYQRENKNQGAIAPIRENLASALIQWTLTKIESKTDLTLVDPMCGSGTFIYEALSMYCSNKNKILSAHFIPLTKDEWRSTHDDIPSPFKQLKGIDKNKFFEKIREEKDGVSFVNADYVNELKYLEDGGIFIFNPPYGKRIKISQNLEEYYLSIINKLMTKKPIAIGLIIPQEVMIKLKTKNFKRHEVFFKNGGLSVKYVLFTSSNLE
jgi:putative N6-adenine-specific DNA methylase